ncbi:CbbQ/NirQ/NorQ/GpvN family protein [Mycolicibacterium pulveris]|nr:CbbQ/NirQ/NorQ/GpvN family protein [Mycolicibacterium pulveris]
MTPVEFDSQSAYYVSTGGECEAMRAACDSGFGVMLTGPTGCGKTRLVRHVTETLGRSLITVSCHDELSASDLLGRYLVVGGDVRWVDGPLTTAVRRGDVCYLDEVAEARRDTLAVLHSLLDDRRELYLDRTGETIRASDGFALMASYNPESRSLLKELKPSFRQRFVTIEVDYLAPDLEAKVVMHESGVSRETAERLVRSAVALRRARHAGIEPPSTRLLVAAARLVVAGLALPEAVRLGIVNPLSAEGPAATALHELLAIEGIVIERDEHHETATPANQG